MQPHVHFHAARCGEALQTALALEGLDARVCFHVCRERALHGEGSKALLALERLLVGVDADVAHQVAGLFEFLGAVRAAMPADAIFLPDGAWEGKKDSFQFFPSRLTEIFSKHFVVKLQGN